MHKSDFNFNVCAVMVHVYIIKWVNSGYVSIFIVMCVLFDTLVASGNIDC